MNAAMEMAPARRAEAGVALIWAILIMIVVLGVITLVAANTLVSTDESRDAANRTRSTMWAQAASDDIVQRIRRREIGYDIVSTLANGDQLVAVPQTGLQVPAGGVTFPVQGASTAARPLTFSRNGTTYRGWYQVLPPRTTAVVETGVTTGWQARFVRTAARPGDQGSYELVVRAWEHGRRAEPVVARMSFRMASYSRFSLLSDDALRIGLGAGMGGGSPAGFIHTNNARNATSAITIEPGTLTTPTRKFSTTRGSIVGCPMASKCAANIREVVEFGAAARAMDAVSQLAALAPPNAAVDYDTVGIARVFGAPAAPPLTARGDVPVWWVDIDGGSCGADRIAVWSTGRYPARRDLVGVPFIDDARPPTMPVGAPACIAVAEGGGAFRFNGDVVVRGYRSSQRPVTILARRESTFPSVYVDMTGDGVLDTAARVSAPASIYLLSDSMGGAIGSSVAEAPVGLVAEGGIYLPSHAMTTISGGSGPNNTVSVNNVAGMAAGAEIAYGPSIIAIAADAGQSGLGLSPDDAWAKGFGRGVQLRWNGSLASRRPATFRYGAASYIGYQQRRITYADQLLWNPPPGFPRDRDWHLADLEEFRSQ